ncbi:helix-turn-helix domain-containing protein [Gordonia sp. KTR9]|uniref:helix-turn-helix domain-containing protein n=1 Tax=Gordonia sp. KTR9 TaxID=337191 RepID=UPI00027DD961|nr:helix-turn-helix domain-containing protein [Gordonia sp. KTR9]AFR46891.1 transcriptional regulator, IclR family [Gordonia sp. KTR9]
MSNPTRRVVDVLNFLARRSERSYSLSELARELDISKSTLHPLVETLVEAGYLLRDSEKLLHLGPVLTGVGQAALGHRGELVDVLRSEMAEIARHYDAHCVLTAELGGWIVPIAASGDPSRVTTLFRIGARTQPFAPPLGVLFLPGRRMGEIQDWFSHSTSDPSPREVDAVMSALDFLRSQGVAAAARTDAKARAERLMLGPTAPGSTRDDESVVSDFVQQLRETQYLITDFDYPDAREIEWVGIPLMNRQERVDVALCVVNFPGALTGHDVLDVGNDLRDRMSRISGITVSPPRVRT